MNEIKRLIAETQEWRRFYRELGGDNRIYAAACAIREQALIDALKAIGGKP